MLRVRLRLSARSIVRGVASKVRCTEIFRCGKVFTAIEKINPKVVDFFKEETASAPRSWRV